METPRITRLDLFMYVVMELCNVGVGCWWLCFKWTVKSIFSSCLKCSCSEQSKPIWCWSRPTETLELRLPVKLISEGGRASDSRGDDTSSLIITTGYSNRLVGLKSSSSVTVDLIKCCMQRWPGFVINRGCVTGSGSTLRSWMIWTRSVNYTCQTTRNNFQHLADETAFFSFMSFLSHNTVISPVVREAGLHRKLLF